MSYKSLFLTLIAVPTCISAYISHINVWKDPATNKFVILLHDIHDHKKEKAAEDVKIVEHFLGALSHKAQIRMYIERIQDTDACTPLRRTLVELQHKDLLLGSLYNTVSHMPTIELKPFDCRIVSALLSILSNFPWLDPDHCDPICSLAHVPSDGIYSNADALSTIYAQAGITMKSLFQEIEQQLATINTFQDGLACSEFYKICIESVENNETLTKLKNKYQAMSPNWQLSIPTFKKELIDFSKGFSIENMTLAGCLGSIGNNIILKILDAYLAHELVQPDQKDITILYYGAAHMEPVSELLSKLHYKPIYSVGNNWQDDPDNLSEKSFQDCLAKITR